MSNKSKKIELFSLIVSICTMLVFISPILLLNYLKTLNSQNIFPFLLSETYIFPSLLFISFFWTFIVFSLFIIPSYFYLITKVTPSKNDTEEFKLPLNEYKLTVLLNPILLYSSLCIFNVNNVFGAIISVSILAANTMLILGSNIIFKTKNKKSYIIQAMSLTTLACFIIFLIINPHIAYMPFIIFLTYLLVTLIKNRSRILNHTKLINYFKLLGAHGALNILCIISISYTATLVIAVNLNGELEVKNGFTDYLITLVIFYIIPNLLFLNTNGLIRYILLASYLFIISFHSNIIEVISYRSFNTMNFINNEAINIKIKKWHDVKLPIPLKNDNIIMTSFNAFQTQKYSLLCNYSDSKYLTYKIHFESLSEHLNRKNATHCVLAENENIYLIQPNNLIETIPVSTEPTLHQYQHL
ncbi:hypothetical protein [Providencia manganoxydans]|uniref:hypothetical protein n=1 Tax=Providencia manganoxydans TaxID=2923283 RepID=UPI0032DA8AFF